MKDKTIVLISLLIASLMLSIAPAFAFYHPSTGTEDGLFENFGPRIDRILIKMYGDLNSEIAALQAGEIDITDWPLTKPLIDTLSADPNVVVLGYGGEAGYYTLNFNNNGNQYLGNPPDPTAPNPVYPNPMSEVSFRQAVSMSIDNAYLCSVLAEGLYDPIYVPVPSYMAYWTHPDIRPGGALAALTYPFDGPSFTNAKALLDADGFPFTGNTGGFRYWDRNGNGVEDAGEAFQLRIYARSDILRRSAGDMEAAGLTTMQINFVRWAISGSQAYETIMVQQNYHSYTAGWINIGPDGDYLYDLYSYENYFWDGSNGPANWAAIGKYNPTQNAYLLALKQATNPTDAQTAAFNFEVSFASEACEKPLASTASPKAFSKFYTGGNDGVAVDPDDGENQYRGEMWDDIVNQKGQGENSWWSTLNMHTVGHELGDGSHMTVRYGWEETGMPNKVNPIYSSWYWESEIWGRVIDGGGARNPMTLGPVEVPQLMESWSQGSWVDPADGITKAAITVTMKPDAMWNDGQPASIGDFIYTLTILPLELTAKGCSPAWWQPTLDQVAGYFKLDDYSATILMKTNSFLALTWIVGNVILPKHWWQPYIAANDASTIMGDIAPGNLVGTGPFLYTALAPGATATLVRNPIFHLQYTDRIDMTFTAADGSLQLAPNKISPNLFGFGIGVFDLTVYDWNLMKFYSKFYNMTVTVQYVAPGAPGPVILIYAEDNCAIPAGALFPRVVGPLGMTLLPGLYEFQVNKIYTSPSPPWLIGVRQTYTERMRVTVAGDRNGDWVVDIFDIAPIAIAFGTSRGQSGYNANADINRDGVIDIFDIVPVALVFGWSA